VLRELVGVRLMVQRRRVLRAVNPTPIRFLQECLWDHLNAQPEYAELRSVPSLPTDPTSTLKEFRFYDGAIFPFDWETGNISGDFLPAHFARIIGGGREKIDDITGFYRFWVSVRLTLLYRASEGDGTLPVDLVDAGMEAIRLALDERARLSQLLAAMGGGEIEWSPRGGPGVGRDPKGGIPQFWGWTWEIDLRGPGFHI
jgi:hypothetical protein